MQECSIHVQIGLYSTRWSYLYIFYAYIYFMLGMMCFDMYDVF